MAKAEDRRTARRDTKARGPLPRGVLEAASLSCGMIVMVVEMAGSRLVSPWLGSSLVVWTSLIGVVMICLSAGYYLGGRLADKHPTARALGYVIMAAAVFTALLAPAANPVLSYISGAVTNLYAGATFAVLILFTLPCVLLGMVSPMIARIALEYHADSMGATVGRFSALSCIGSIAGTFLGGFVLVSLFSTGVIFCLSALALAATAALLLCSGGKERASLLALPLFLAAAVGAHVLGMPMEMPGLNIDTRYNHLQIYDIPVLDRQLRVMKTDPRIVQSSMFVDAPDDLLSTSYLNYYELARLYRGEVSNFLMLGGGGYSLPKYIAKNYPDTAVDVVELDPDVTKAAAEHFAFRQPDNMRIFHEDARTYLNRSGEKYGAAFWDIFSSAGVIPFHLATVESAQRMSDMLDDEGIVVINVISAARGYKSGIFKGIYGAFAEVFPTVEAFAVSSSARPDEVQNLVILASKSKELTARRAASPMVERMLASRLKEPVERDVPAFRDGFAPVELYSLRAFHGGDD